MAQAQLQFTEDMLKGFGFTHVKWSPLSRTITCQLDETVSLVMYKKRHNISVTLRKRVRKGIQTISLPIAMLETLCDLKESIQLLTSFLEGQA